MSPINIYSSLCFIGHSDNRVFQLILYQKMITGHCFSKYDAYIGRIISGGGVTKCCQNKVDAVKNFSTLILMPHTLAAI